MTDNTSKEDEIQEVEISEVNAESGQPEDSAKPAEIGGRKGPEPTRFGDWEKNGRCIDF